MGPKVEAGIAFAEEEEVGAARRRRAKAEARAVAAPPHHKKGASKWITPLSPYYGAWGVGLGAGTRYWCSATVRHCERKRRQLRYGS